MSVTLTDNQAKLDNIDKTIKIAMERKRKVIILGVRANHGSISCLLTL